MKKATRKTQDAAALRQGNRQTVRAFAELANALAAYAVPYGVAQLTNVTFWCGAGFSKAWEPRSPTGHELFNLDEKDIHDRYGFDLDRILGVDTLNALSEADLQKINYFLDMNEKYPDIRSRYIDSQNIEILRGYLRVSVLKKFNKICGLNHTTKESYKFFTEKETRPQEKIRNFFHNLFIMGHGSAFAEGIRYHFITTNYDFVIESILDPPDPDNSPHIHTYRGFSPLHIDGYPNPKPLHSHMLVHHLIKLNGGFEILQAHDGNFDLDYRGRSDKEIAERPPILMLPSREQNYTHPYFAAVFPKAVRLMRDTRILVIVGYSLPPEDTLIRFILRQFSEEMEDSARKAILYIDLHDHSKRLEEIFSSISDQEIPNVHRYIGDFADFATDCARAWTER